jgi:hypothetical protein
LEEVKGGRLSKLILPPAAIFTDFFAFLASRFPNPSSLDPMQPYALRSDRSPTLGIEYDGTLETIHLSLRQNATWEMGDGVSCWRWYSSKICKDPNPKPRNWKKLKVFNVQILNSVAFAGMWNMGRRFYDANHFLPSLVSSMLTTIHDYMNGKNCLST